MITRFAPSPTGPLHLGHAYAAQVAHDLARKNNGQFLVRFEDIDRSRSKKMWEDRILQDLDWLGLHWDGEVARQSERMQLYQDAIGQLTKLGLLYPCKCRRSDIQAALSAPQEGAPLIGPDGLIYPGTCRGRTMASVSPQDVLRLDIQKAIEHCSAGNIIEFQEVGPIYEGHHRLDMQELVTTIGDVIISRRDMGTSYHLSVVVDDADQGITMVTRGADLFEATPIHRVLQMALKLPAPVYFHHDLIRDAAGKRLAKRDDSRSIESYRTAGVAPAKLRASFPAAGSSLCNV